MDEHQLRRCMKSTLLVIGLLFLVSAEAPAVTTGTAEVTCPIGGGHFQIRRFRSFTTRPERLDRKRVVLGSPQLLPLAVCPKNFFVPYKNQFSKNEITLASKYISTSPYLEAINLNTSAGLAAIIAAHLGEPPRLRAQIYLYASWEAEERVLIPESKYKRLGSGIRNWNQLTRQYREAALLANDEAIKTIRDPEARANRLLLSAELARLLSKFNAAINYLAEAIVPAGRRSTNRLSALKVRIAEELAIRSNKPASSELKPCSPSQIEDMSKGICVSKE
jgi:hypothetical protein